MPDEVRVDPALLRAGAAACRDVHQGITPSLSDVEPQTIAAEQALPGWATATVLKDIVWWWRDDVSGLGRVLGTTADALEACAHDYDLTDHANAAHFDQVRRPW